MKSKRTPNGKTCFDIRNQFHRVNDALIIRYRKILQKKIDDGEITTSEQYLEIAEKHVENLRRLFDYAYSYANSVSNGSFSLYYL